MTDVDVRLCALEIASLSVRLADMANETGDLRCPLAEIAARMAAVAQELASGSVVELRQSGTRDNDPI